MTKYYYTLDVPGYRDYIIGDVTTSLHGCKIRATRAARAHYQGTVARILLDEGRGVQGDPTIWIRTAGGRWGERASERAIDMKRKGKERMALHEGDKSQFL